MRLLRELDFLLFLVFESFTLHLFLTTGVPVAVICWQSSSLLHSALLQVGAISLLLLEIAATASLGTEMCKRETGMNS